MSGLGEVHLHGTDEPGWIEHAHMDGRVPHEHDPETGSPVPLDHPWTPSSKD